jgi:hypothetical protein
LKKYKKNISLFVNGKTINLSDLLEIGKSNGWNEQEVLNGFKFT